MTLCLPGNHWLYRLHSDEMRSSANFLAVASWTFSFSLSAKFDFLSQPEAEELSVWLSRQDSLSSVLWKKSIQMLITQAMNSSEFIDVRRRQSTGSSKRHAIPVVMLYPPRPNSEIRTVDLGRLPKGKVVHWYSSES